MFKFLYKLFLGIASCVFFLVIIPPLAESIHSLITQDKVVDPRTHLPTYQSEDWSDDHFQDLAELRIIPYDYISYRREDFSSDTINIEKGVRKTEKPKIILNKGEFWFFGGSVVWGTGVNDANTISSKFAKRHGVIAYNYGETGYQARNSLAYFLNLMINRNESVDNNTWIFFFGGLSDVVLGCLASNREPMVFNQKRISAHQSYFIEKREKFYWSKILEEPYRFMNLIKQKYFVKQIIDYDNLYDCDKDPIKAENVAKALVHIWKQSYQIAISNNMEFTAILQPTAYSSNLDQSYFEFTNHDAAKQAQFEAVYPLIIKYANSENLNFLDFSGIYDDCDDCFIDWAHTSPGAKEILVKHLTENIEPLK